MRLNQKAWEFFDKSFTEQFQYAVGKLKERGHMEEFYSGLALGYKSGWYMVALEAQVQGHITWEEIEDKKEEMSKQWLDARKEDKET